jgi:malonyl CoA-acyl carrier protein transacylase
MAMMALPEPVLLLAGENGSELVARLAAPDDHLLGQGSTPEPGPARLGIVAPTERKLALARRVVAGGKPWYGRKDVWFAPTPLLRENTRMAYVFPGLEGEFAPSIEDVAHWLGAPAPALNTGSIGPHAASVLAVGRLLDTALRRLGIRPDAVVGHSVGEWTAMIVGGLFDGAEFDDLLASTDLNALVVPGVQFAVLGCDADTVRKALAPELVISHENSTRQTVVCGPDAPVAELVARFRERGVICQLLPFRSGFHTPMMRPYLAPFESGIGRLPIHSATAQVWSTTTAGPFPADTEAVRALCVRQLLETVRFRETVHGLYGSGVRVFVQLGSGQLGSLVDDTLHERDHLTVAANSAHRSGLDQLRRVAVALWTAGANPDFAALAPTVERADPLARLAALAQDHPLVGEFHALLGEIADSVATVVEAAAGTNLHVSTDTMPYLRDHCFVSQRDGWPDEADRRPVVPATTVLAHLMTAAERNAQGRIAVGVDDLRLHRWLLASPARQVTLRVRAAGQDRMHVSIDDTAEADVLLADRYPAPPAPLPAEPGERAPQLRADQLYEQRWLFHGPGFQSVTRSLAISPDGIRGELTVLDAPGSLLDGVGQLLGQWLVERHPERWIAFPIRLGRVRWHAQEPPAGTVVVGTVRVRAVNEDTIVADAEVRHAGRVLVSITDWTDRRFDSDERAAAVQRFPSMATLSRRSENGWWLASESSPSLASREYYLQKYLVRAEHEEYLATPPRTRREWLLRRIAVKDAVRGHLWDHGAGPLFPAEIAVADDGPTHCTASGRYRDDLPKLPVAVAYCRDIAVAILGEGATIDLTEVPANAPAVSAQNAAELDGSAVDVPAQNAAELDGSAVRARLGAELVDNPPGWPPRRYLVTWTQP